MLERFFKLKQCVQEALIDVDSGINFCADEFITFACIFTTVYKVSGGCATPQRSKSF
jgi:hypothetical protein